MKAWYAFKSLISWNPPSIDTMRRLRCFRRILIALRSVGSSRFE